MSQALPVSFSCEGDTLLGVLHRPAQPGPTGVLVVVGGPQYRVGSHRQFVLLGRALAQRGVAVLRFDYRGIGDSGGEPRGFEAIDVDVRAAIDELFRRVPQLERVVLWGLCDAASAVMFYGHRDARVAGLVALNPWVRSTETVARAYLRHYYLRRLFDRDLWRELLTGRKSPLALLRSLGGAVREASGRGSNATSHGAVATAVPPYVERMRRGLAAFGGPVLLVLSGDDITAAEFRDVAQRSRAWRRLLASPRVTTQELPEADHTFSSRAWRDEVARWTGEWIEAHWPSRRSAGGARP